MTDLRTSSPEARLRLVLRINAVTSGLGGLVAAVAAGPLDEILGTGEVGWVRIVGVGLVVFAVSVGVTSRRDRDELVRAVPAISLGDASWVVGSLVAMALGWFSTGGAIVMGVVALMVAVYCVEQTMLVRQLGRPAGPATA